MLPPNRHNHYYMFSYGCPMIFPMISLWSFFEESAYWKSEAQDRPRFLKKWKFLPFQFSPRHSIHFPQRPQLILVFAKHVRRTSMASEAPLKLRCWCSDRLTKHWLVNSRLCSPNMFLGGQGICRPLQISLDLRSELPTLPTHHTQPTCFAVGFLID